MKKKRKKKRNAKQTHPREDTAAGGTAGQNGPARPSRKNKRFQLLLLMGRPARKRTRKGKVMAQEFHTNPHAAPQGRNYNQQTLRYQYLINSISSIFGSNPVANPTEPYATIEPWILQSLFRSNPMARLTKLYILIKTWLSATIHKAMHNLYNLRMMICSSAELPWDQQCSTRITG